MTTLKTQAKLTSISQYGDRIFSVKPESKNFDKLVKIAAIAKSNFTTYKPIYVKTINDVDYITLICKGGQYKLDKRDRGSTFELEVKFTTKTHDEKKYLNVWINNFKKIKGIVLPAQGEDWDWMIDV